jgi:hypothetical protein
VALPRLRRGRPNNGGNGIHLVMATKGVSFAEAVRMIEHVAGTASPGLAHANGKLRDPLRPWRNARPFILGTIADTYLKNRGLPLTIDEAGALRFDSALWHWPSEQRLPAMIALVRHADGQELCAHMTFLADDGSGKAAVEKPRLFPAGSEPVGGGVWLGGEIYPEAEFIVGEGIESTISAARLYGPSAAARPYRRRDYAV